MDKSFFPDRPIAFCREYKTITKSTNSALMLSQLVYWWKRKTGDTIYKTITEFEDETGLSREEQQTAIKNLTTLGIISVKVKGIPPVRHFTLNESKLCDLLFSICGVTANRYVGLPQIIYTENTTDKYISKDIYDTSVKKKEKISQKENIDLILDKFLQHFGQYPIDKHPRNVAWNFYRNIVAYIKATGSEVTWQEAVDLSYGKYKQVFPKFQVFKLETVRLYIKSGFETKIYKLKHQII